jgi:hypothetical protein
MARVHARDNNPSPRALFATRRRAELSRRRRRPSNEERRNAPFTGVPRRGAACTAPQSEGDRVAEAGVRESSSAFRSSMVGGPMRAPPCRLGILIRGRRALPMLGRTNRSYPTNALHTCRPGPQGGGEAPLRGDSAQTTEEPRVCRTFKGSDGLRPVDLLLTI